MITTSLDVLYLVLAGCAVLLSIMLSILIGRVISAIKQAQDIGIMVEHVLDSVERYIKLPARVLFSMTDKAKTVRDFFAGRNK